MAPDASPIDVDRKAAPMTEAPTRTPAFVDLVFKSILSPSPPLKLAAIGLALLCVVGVWFGFERGTPYMAETREVRVDAEGTWISDGWWRHGLPGGFQTLRCGSDLCLFPSNSRACDDSVGLVPFPGPVDGDPRLGAIQIGPMTFRNIAGSLSGSIMSLIFAEPTFCVFCRGYTPYRTVRVPYRRIGAPSCKRTG